MKPGRFSLSLAVLLALAFSGSALAQHQGRQGRNAQQQQQQQGAQRPMMPPSERPRDAAWRNNRQGQPQHGRMSDEERQQLRRDISDHGRDIYQDRSASRRQ